MPFGTTAKRLLHETAARMGLYVSRLPPTPVERDALAALLRDQGIDLVLDVGANVGQYAQGLIAKGFTGRIVSFEPLSGPYAQLSRASAAHARWEVAPRCCLGEREQERVELNVAESSIASSLVAGTSELTEHAPRARTVGTEAAPMFTLDQVADRYLEGASAPFLKIDVQGYEDQVLAGAANTLPRLRGLQIELSLVRLYENQSLLSEALPRIEAMGFDLYLLSCAFPEKRTGRWLQTDAVFFRRD